MTVATRRERAHPVPLPRASVAWKLVVSLSGLFLVVFLLVHLGVNLTLFGGADAYNSAAHFMGTNPLIVAMRPVLALGFLVHLLVSAWLWLGNRGARPQRYAVVDPAGGSTWASRNMLVLGALVFAFLALHLSSFSIKLAFGAPPLTSLHGAEVKDVYALVTGQFGIWWYSALYVAAMVLLGLHLSHGFQSAFQTLGLSDAHWRRRWTLVGNLYSVIVAVGFASLPAFFFVRALMGDAP
jgi:succinate dehydrogenase / fumarate reductase cytochrome b subunit